MIYWSHLEAQVCSAGAIARVVLGARFGSQGPRQRLLDGCALLVEFFIQFSAYSTQLSAHDGGDDDLCSTARNNLLLNSFKIDWEAM